MSATLPPPNPSVSIKLASIAVHAQEASSAEGREVDLDVLRHLSNDPEVQDWLDDFDPALLPVKRNA